MLKTAKGFFIFEAADFAVVVVRPVVLVVVRPVVVW